MLATRFALLLIGYQVIAAAGTYLIEFVLFDRAAARYDDAASLTRFLSTYTALLNLVDILFLVLLAGVLLRRFGLRLGIAANPALVTAARRGDARLGDRLRRRRARPVRPRRGCSRRRHHAEGRHDAHVRHTAYQLLPAEERAAVQAAVEGAGVPVAIGATGMALFALRALDAPVSLIVGVTVAVCVVWTLSAALLYSDYARALAGALKRQILPDATPDLGDSETAAALHRMLASDDAREVRLGLDLLVATSSPAAQTELARLSRDPRADVRMPALARLAGDGNARAAALLESDIAGLSTSRDVADRGSPPSAWQCGPGSTARRSPPCSRDPEPAVRADGLGRSGRGDTGHVQDVVAALEDPRDVRAAVAALADSAMPSLPSVANALAARAVPVPRGDRAPARGCGTPRRRRWWTVRPARRASGPRARPRRPLGARGRRSGSGATGGGHRAGSAGRRRACPRCLSALAAVTPAPLLERALRDELMLLRERVLALLAVRHGAEAIHLVALGLASDAESRCSLAIEMLDVTLGRGEATLALPVVRTDLPDRTRLQQLAELAPDAQRSSSRARRPHRRPRRALAIALAGGVCGLRGAQSRIAAAPRRAAEELPIRCFARPWNGPRAAPRSKGSRRLPDT